MNSSNDETLARLKMQEERRLAKLPYYDRHPTHVGHGVLLSDQIEYYAKQFKMIEPFDQDECLQPAGYTLRVGNNYAINNERHTLNENGTLEIPMYQVAIIQTLETLNLPQFLIGRWNIRVKWAYEGLLWVGGAQVNPGFRGRLSCPIYNLLNQSVTLKHGARLAMIDFVTTTPFRRGVSIPYVWNGLSSSGEKRKLVFEEYNSSLQSGVKEKLGEQDKNIKEVETFVKKDVDEIRRRIDTFVTLVFAVVAVLFAGLGVVATKGSEGPSFWGSTVWVAAAAFYLALRSYAAAWNVREAQHPGERAGSSQNVQPTGMTGHGFWQFWRQNMPEVALVVSLALISVGYHLWDARLSAIDVREARREATKALAAVESLQQQINVLQRNAVEQT
jgi:deoxycytidine triphosphate deaminase